MSGALPAYGLGAGELWKQSVSASLSTDVLRMKSSVTIPPEAAPLSGPAGKDKPEDKKAGATRTASAAVGKRL